MAGSTTLTNNHSFPLTFPPRNGIIVPHGEMSERFKELVLKTSDGATHRGFESHSLRQKKTLSKDKVFFNEINPLRDL